VRLRTGPWTPPRSHNRQRWTRSPLPHERHLRGNAPLKLAVQKEAKRLGFDACKFAPAVKPPHAEAFKKWLEEGRAGEMHWLERNAERRTDPQQVLAGAKTVIMVACNYAPAALALESPPDYQIARYASERTTMKCSPPRIRALEEVLAQHGGRAAQLHRHRPRAGARLRGACGTGVAWAKAP
jgi:epoxyqueuosine reductase QueG